MHAVMRRVPAERARHAKRLGHQVRANGPTITTSQTATTATPVSPSQTPSTVQSPSSSPSTSSTTRPSSASSSATSASTSTSSASSESSTTQTPTLAASSSSSITLPQPTTSTYTYTTSTPTPTSAPTTTHSGLSGGAIAGIIAGAVIVGVAFIVFLVRKTYLRRRERQRISWNGASALGAGIPDEPKFPDINERLVSDLPSHPGAPLSPFEARGQSVYSTPVPSAHMQPPTMPSYGVPALPPATYNNPGPVAAYPTQPFHSTYNRVGSTTPFSPGVVATGTPPPVRGQHAPSEALVKCTFVPTLPDELSITTGERVFVLEQYDDGWNLCANARGERGMVPRDCLENAPVDQPGIGWKNVARTSSLTPDGTRF